MRAACASMQGGGASGSTAASDGVSVEMAALREAYAGKYMSARELMGATDLPLASREEVLALLTGIEAENGAAPQGSKKLVMDFCTQWCALKIRLDDALEAENAARQQAQHAEVDKEHAAIDAMTASVKKLQPLWKPCGNFAPLDFEQHAHGEQRLLEHLVLKVEQQGEMLRVQGEMLAKLMGLVGAPVPLRTKHPGVEGAKVLLAAGNTPLALRSAGYTTVELRDAGCNAAEMHLSGYTAVRF